MCFTEVKLKAALLNVISGAVLAGSTHIAEFIAFRFVAGAGAFSILAAVPVSLPQDFMKREIESNRTRSG